MSVGSQREEQDRSLLWLLSGAGERFVAVIHAFLDESGTNPETPVLTVAGFYGCQGQWETFKNLWRPLLQGRDFHALHSATLYSGLCFAIRQSAIDGLFCTIGKETYRQHANEHLKTFAGNTYAVCVFLCALGICTEVNNEPVSFVLERGQPNIAFVKRIMEDMMDAGEFCIASVATARKEEFIELHPADFVSHLASSHDKPWLEHLMEAGRLKHGHITEQMIREASPEVTALVGRARHERNKAKRTR